MTNEQKRKQILGFIGAYSKRLEKLYDSFKAKYEHVDEMDDDDF